MWLINKFRRIRVKKIRIKTVKKYTHVLCTTKSTVIIMYKKRFIINKNMVVIISRNNIKLSNGYISLLNNESIGVPKLYYYRKSMVNITYKNNIISKILQMPTTQFIKFKDKMKVYSCYGDNLYIDNYNETKQLYLSGVCCYSCKI